MVLGEVRRLFQGTTDNMQAGERVSWPLLQQNVYVSLGEQRPFYILPDQGSLLADQLPSPTQSHPQVSSRVCPPVARQLG